MAKQVFTNNALSQLSGSLPQGGTTLVCSAGQGARFPSLAGGDFFYLTLYTKDAYTNEQNVEIVKVTARVGDVFTIVRDIEVITGQAGGFAYNGSLDTVYLEIRWTAGCVDNMAQKTDLVDVVTGGASGFMTGADKAKLDGVASGANNYTHPGNHAPSIITQDSGNRFVTDAEKSAWNAKGVGDVTLAGAQTITNKTINASLNTMTVDGVNVIGFRNIPQNIQSTAYTCVLEDASKHILHPTSDTTARTFTIPANASVAYPIGAAITFVNQVSAGVLTIQPGGTDVMRLAGAGTTGNRTLAANGIATAIKVTATEWIISGTGLT